MLDGLALEEYRRMRRCGIPALEAFELAPRNAARLARTPRVTCCGAVLYCPAFTNRCPTCSAFYNFAGQRLAPPSQWGEETGERFADDGTQIL